MTVTVCKTKFESHAAHYLNEVQSGKTVLILSDDGRAIAKIQPSVHSETNKEAWSRLSEKADAIARKLDMDETEAMKFIIDSQDRMRGLDSEAS